MQKDVDVDVVGIKTGICDGELSLDCCFQSMLSDEDGGRKLVLQ